MILHTKSLRKLYIKYYGPIPKGWCVHHLDMNKGNNEPENLIVMPNRMKSYVDYLYKIHKVTFPNRLLEATIEEIRESEYALRLDIEAKERELSLAKLDYYSIGHKNLDALLVTVKSISKKTFIPKLIIRRQSEMNV